MIDNIINIKGVLYKVGDNLKWDDEIWKIIGLDFLDSDQPIQLQNIERLEHYEWPDRSYFLSRAIRHCRTSIINKKLIKAARHE